MIDSSVVPPVMPAHGSGARGQAPAGIHDFLWCDKGKSWIPAFAGMTMWKRRWVNVYGRWYQDV
jgi:hypothetical protein